MAVTPATAGQPPTDSPPGRPSQYRPALEMIRASRLNTWWVLATFTTLTGARDAKSRIVTGRTAIPEPRDGYQWEFKAVRNDHGSELFVRQTKG